MIHRHRLAPDIASRMARMRERGELAVVAGRPMRIEAGADACRVIYRPRGGELERSLEADWILNCVGPSEDLARVDDPLWADLFGSGLVRAGPLGLGLDVDPALRLIDSQGDAHPDLFALGLPTRGRFWEVTAVIHIRQQAEALAARLALAQESPSMVA
jgi:uncharacterized NAD(P)/FAD-binding protein YdhS